jgi:hypothetical protein
MTTKSNFESHNSLLMMLSELMEMDKFTQKKVGFLSIMKIDEHTFTIHSLNDDEFTSNIPREDLISECIIKTDPK